MICICKKELFHQRQGFDALLPMMSGTEMQRELAHQAVNWWWPLLMMFGLSDKNLIHSNQSSKVGYQAYRQRRF